MNNNHNGSNTINRNSKRGKIMKDIKEIDAKELKTVVKELNDMGILDKKIKIVGAKTENILKEFTEAIESLPEDADIPASIATFYNDIYADELDDESEGSNEDADGDEGDADEDADEDEGDADADEDSDGDKDSDIDEPEEDAPKVEPVPEKSPKAPKKDKKSDIVKEKAKPSIIVEKRASINPKMSLTSKVKNILNFAGQQYKQTAYFPLDCETIRQLETNVGLYPSEILLAIQNDKKSAKKIEGFTEAVCIREINKIKSAYSYIVGAIKETKEGSKFRHIMTALVAGKSISSDIAHISTVKVAKRALLAYMDVSGIDYSVLKDVRKELVVAASKKEKAPAKEKTPAKATVIKDEPKSPKSPKK